ncbi:MAG: HAD family hydrolase [Oscillibacter sp.]|nr:HAD family hydrolase [Oscillibacter sp.]
MFSTVIFDLDGTLLNTIDDLAAAGNHVCRENHWPEYSVEQFKAMVGHGVKNLVAKFVPAGVQTPEVLDRALAQFSAYYGAHSTDLTAAYPGMGELLERLQAAGVRMAVYSNKDHSFTVELMERFFPGRFALVQGKKEGIPVKPDPTGVLGILAQLGADPETTLFVGDSSVDIATGHNAGLRACGVTWGFRSEQSLVDAGADFLARDARELEGVIL